MNCFNVSSKINLNFGKIRQLSKTAQTALEQTTDEFLTEVENAEVMPFDTGNLQNESTFADYSGSANGTTKIISSTPYARRLYFHPEYNFSTKEHTNAQGKWLEPWLKGGEKEDFCTKTFAEIYRRLNKL